MALVALPVVWWIRGHERQILRTGRELSETEAQLASAVGVADVRRIRVCLIDPIPMPGPAWAHRTAQRLGFPALRASGLCLGHGIYLQRPRLDILVHECVHTAQYERLGAGRFLRHYLSQCLHDGYAAAVLEREAVETATRVLSDQASI